MIGVIIIYYYLYYLSFHQIIKMKILKLYSNKVNNVLQIDICTALRRVSIAKIVMKHPNSKYPLNTTMLKRNFIINGNNKRNFEFYFLFYLNETGNICIGKTLTQMNSGMNMFVLLLQ